MVHQHLCPTPPTSLPYANVIFSQTPPKSQAITLRTFANISQTPAFQPRLHARSFSTKRTVQTHAAASSPTATSAVCERSFHSLPDSVRLEVLSTTPAKPTTKPPLVFVHGSYHAAWCWAEQFMPFFTENGYTCYAISLRGQGGSDKENVKVGGTLASHAQDVVHFIQTLQPSTPPVVIAHSMAGPVLKNILGMPAQNGMADGQKDRRTDGQTNGVQQRPNMAGAVLLASAPPSGSSSIVGRMFKETPLLAAKVTWAFISANFTKDLDSCRMMFFSDSLPANELKRYQQLLAANYNAIPVIDVRNVRNEFPPPIPTQPLPPVFVGGGDKDNVVDLQALQETAEWVGLDKAVVIEDMAHDVMLDSKWREMAGEMLKFLEKL